MVANRIAERVVVLTESDTDVPQLLLVGLSLNAPYSLPDDVPRAVLVVKLLLFLVLHHYLFGRFCTGLDNCRNAAGGFNVDGWDLEVSQHESIFRRWSLFGTHLDEVQRETEIIFREAIKLAELRWFPNTNELEEVRRFCKEISEIVESMKWLHEVLDG